MDGFPELSEVPDTTDIEDGPRNACPKLGIGKLGANEAVAEGPPVACWAFSELSNELDGPAEEAAARGTKLARLDADAEYGVFKAFGGVEAPLEVSLESWPCMDTGGLSASDAMDPPVDKLALRGGMKSGSCGGARFSFMLEVLPDGVGEETRPFS